MSAVVQVRLPPSWYAGCERTSFRLLILHRRSSLRPGTVIQASTCDFEWAEQLPFADQAFDGALAQLVVHFMADPREGLSEMVRVIRPGGVVAACVWDHAGGRGPLGLFWDAARELDPEVEDRRSLPVLARVPFPRLFHGAGLREIEETALTVGVEHPSFDDWWEPFTLGVGPAGSHTAALDARRQAQLRERCREALPAAPFVLRAQASGSTRHPRLLAA